MSIGRSAAAVAPVGSLWEATAVSGPITAPLAGNTSVEVCIVGAGFTGLSAALHLAELGVSVVVLESGGPGFGASGRNGGQVSLGSSGIPTSSLRGMVPSAVTGSFPSWVQRQILSTM